VHGRDDPGAVDVLYGGSAPNALLGCLAGESTAPVSYAVLKAFFLTSAADVRLDNKGII
jgi:hypothetical protein